MRTSSSQAVLPLWLLILIVGTIVGVSMGRAQSMGLYLQPVTAALNAVHDEQVDEIIVSTFPEGTSDWLGRDVVGRVEQCTERPVTHVVVAPAEAQELI